MVLVGTFKSGRAGSLNHCGIHSVVGRYCGMEIWPLQGEDLTVVIVGHITPLDIARRG